MPSFLTNLSILNLAGIALAAPAPVAAPAALESRALSDGLVFLRIEGANGAIYEGPIYSTPRNITTKSGGTHHCDGTNFGANPVAGATCTTALDAASKLEHFQYDGSYSTTFGDYFITSIGDTSQTSSQFWGILINFQFSPTGGCQQETKTGDEVLWAFDAFNANAFLKVEPNVLVVAKGSSATVTVSDGQTGTTGPAQGAVIDSATVGADGKVTLTFNDRGFYRYKATKPETIRSNTLYVEVY